MNSIKTTLLAVYCFILTQTAFAQSIHLITQTSVGNIKLGMTVAELRRAAAPMSLSRSSDGEGVALIALKKGNQEMIILYAGEADPSQKIDESALIESIQAWSPCYKTPEGVHVSMPLKDVEKLYGKLKLIQRSEIESREYATFSKQPKGITIRVSGKNGRTAGLYVNNSNKAMSYSKEAYIMSISIP